MNHYRSIKTVLISMILFILLLSCNLFSEKSEEVNDNGSLSLTIENSINRTITPTFSISSYRITFSNGPVTKDPILITNTTETVPLAIGNWDISIDALDSNLITIATGSVSNIQITADTTTSETITLDPLSTGTGTVDVTFSWPESESIDVKEITLDGVTIDASNLTESATNGTVTLRYHQNLSPGDYKLKLLLKTGDVLKLTSIEIVKIYGNLTSSVFIDINETDFTGIPSSPNNLIANEGFGSINISWNDNSCIETGFILERRVLGDNDFIVLDSNLLYNTSSYIDDDIISDVDYEYRVKAFNKIGDSEFSNIDSCSLVNPNITGLDDDYFPKRSKNFIWDSNEESATFRYIISSDSTVPENWNDIQWSDTTSTTYDTYNGTFYLHIQSSDIAGNLSEIVTVSFILDNIPPDDPIINCETNTIDVTPTWFWIKGSDVTKVEVQVDSIDVDNWIEIIESDATSFTPDTPLNYGNHTLFIRYMDEAGNWTDPSTSNNGTVNIVDNVYIDELQVNNENSDNLILSWNEIEGAVLYEILIGSGYPISEITLIASGNGYSSRFELNKTLDYDKTYYCNIRVKNDNDDWIDVGIINEFDNPTNNIPFKREHLIDMYPVGPGNFMMGWSNIAEPVHEVSITDSFYIGSYEITYDQWEYVKNWALLRGYNFLNGIGEQGFGDNTDGDHPVTMINWGSAIIWCNALSELEGLIPCYYENENFSTVLRDVALYGDSLPVTHVDWTANGYRLPTEAEWEFSARQAVFGGFNNGNVHSGYDYDSNLTNSAWYYSNSNNSTHPVGQKIGNNNGLYDMNGNVWEWVWDLYEPYSESSQVNPTGPISGTYRVVRGGSYGSLAIELNTSNRGETEQLDVVVDHGFRVVRH